MFSEAGIGKSNVIWSRSNPVRPAVPPRIITLPLALTPGTRLGVYEIIAQIGECGMGQVYRATDTKLKLQVAIKILPPSLAADANRLARFQRETEVLASLNHLNIAAIDSSTGNSSVRSSAVSTKP